ncbi:protein MEMO1 [Aspergillus stella-maris]|uniref:protein MEMO1 n=1 Tax=Aspergillus stella-maris TaxID=1810926 RepID=UPI003CCD1AB1
MPFRAASHSGSWYSDDPRGLTRQLDQWLAQVPDSIEGLGSLPVPGARIVIAPHAGYRYSGACAAYAYKALDLSKAKRIFVLGPSHHHYFASLALPSLTGYYTPLSDDPLPLDTELIAKLRSSSAVKPNGSTIAFDAMSQSVDEDEHSIELHLPYIHRLLQLQHPDKSTAEYPPLVPILVGSTSTATEKAFGELLAPYLKDSINAFVISSDFCHWGLRFRYTYYVPQAPQPGPRLPVSSDALPQPEGDVAEIQDKIELACAGHQLQRRDRIQRGEPLIHESISAFDIATMAAIATGKTRNFTDILEKTGNTVCGRHPIGVIMAAIEAAGKQDGATAKGKFHFARYERSGDIKDDVYDSSVSYVSAFAVV